ncbi:serine/threonine-protein kinase [Paractinoplanes toevensis]|nr:serine/threonine-protein kinase [Actinoplanes toevensis]
MPLRPGDPTRLGVYDLLDRLGQGGMGTVFRGRAADGSMVAIKMVRPEFADDPEFRGRFRSEVSRAQQVPPFSTAAVLDADPEHTPPYLVVEFVDGPSLTELVRDRGPLSGPALQSVAVGIATALTAIHSAGVIHRDLKPGNVLIAPGGIKVIDFGIARAFEATSRHTRTDQMVGTVAYMAPERFDPEYGAEVTSAADVFAWGAVVTYAATGRTPFAGESPTVTAMRILTQPPDTSGVPEPLRGLVESALAKYPEQRPTARQLLDALLGGRLVAPVPLPPPDDPAEVAPPAEKPRRGGPRRFAAALAALAVLLAGGLYGAHRLTMSDSSLPARGPASQAAPVDGLTAILAGDRRFSIQLGKADRYFMLDRGGDELELSDGTGSRSQFVLEPVGVEYLIRSLGNEGYAGPETCLGVRIIPGEQAAPVVGAACTPTKGTLFSVDATGDKDAKGRPTYSIRNEYGWVLWDSDAKRSDVAEVGEPQFADKYTLVDRGELGSAATPSATSPSPSAAPTTTGPALVDANLSELKSFAIELGVPVVVTTSLDAGAEYHLDARPDGTVDFTGTAVTETTRMTLKPAKVRKRTDENKNHVVIVASPVAAATGPESCVTDVRKGSLRMQPCRPGDAAQSWHLTPAGDSGLFELTGAHSALQVDQGHIVADGGWATFQTVAVTR